MLLRHRISAARTEDIVVSRVGNEVIVFDRRTNQIHHLDATCSAVWSAMDTDRSLAELASITGLVDESIIAAALAQMANAGILDIPSTPESLQRRTMTRRRVLGRAAVAVSMPAIVSVTAPAAAAQASINCAERPDGLHSNPNDCGSYIACSGGRAYVTPCPVGLHFNPNLEICDWPHEAGCA